MADITKKDIEELLAESSASKQRIALVPPSDKDGMDGDIVHVKKAFMIVEYKKIDGVWYSTGNSFKSSVKHIWKERHGSGFPSQATIQRGTRNTGNKGHGGKGSSVSSRVTMPKGRKKGLKPAIITKTRPIPKKRIPAGIKQVKEIK